MRLLRFALLAVFGLALGGCSAFENVTSMFRANPYYPVPSAQIERNYALVDAVIRVPSDLVVSEANMYYPLADIVWRGDPPGDRYAQVASLFSDAVELAKPGLTGDVPVIVELTLVRLHGVTEKTRATVGGNYNIRFTMTVRDAATLQVIEPTREIEADLGAPGGSAALILERDGQTERVRVTDFISYVLVKELGGLGR